MGGERHLTKRYQRACAPGNTVRPFCFWAALTAGLLLVPSTGWGQGSEWKWLTGGNLKAVKFVGQKGWIIGDDGNQGIILHTTDGGDTWAIQPHNTGKHYFNALSVVDSLNLWIVGGNQLLGEVGFLLRTRDGGQTWTSVNVPVNPQFNDVCYIDSSYGWLTGNTDSIYRTTNGGLLWVGTQVNTKYATIEFVDSLRGFSTDGYYLAKTTDGGQTWTDTLLNDGYGPTPYLDMVNNLEGWMVGIVDGARHTLNGWASWSYQPIPSSSGFYGLSFINNQVGYAVGGSGTALGTIARTTNGGLTWSADSGYISSEPLYGVDATAINAAQTVGGGGALLKTTNAGNTWSVIRNVDIAGSLLSVSFWNNNQGWAVGTYGTITHTTNGGTVWQLQSSGTSNFLYGVDFPSLQRGWVCSDGAEILSTANAGSTWTFQTSNTSYPLFSLDFWDTLVGVAVGGYYGPPEPPITGINGTLDNHGLHGLRQTTDYTVNDTLKHWGTGLDFWKYPWKPWEIAPTTPYRTITRTTNGGALWIAQNTTGQVPLYGVSFVSPSEGWACGDPQGGMGVILHTTDFGATWQGQTSNVSQGLYWIQFKDALTGWCVGNNGTALWTTDGGNTWNSGNSGTTAPLWSCAFYDNLNGFACGNNGLLIKTVDGGRNWTGDTSQVYANLTAVNALDSTYAWTVGSYGMVLGWKEAGVSGMETRGQGDKETRGQGIALEQSYPNPMKEDCAIGYWLNNGQGDPGLKTAGVGKETRGQGAELNIYDVTGRRIRFFAPLRMTESGKHTVVWDGKDETGKNVPAGVYFYQLRTKDLTETKKLVKIQ